MISAVFLDGLEPYSLIDIHRLYLPDPQAHCGGNPCMLYSYWLTAPSEGEALSDRQARLGQLTAII